MLPWYDIKAPLMPQLAIVRGICMKKSTHDGTFDHQVELVRDDGLDEVVEVARVDSSVLFCRPAHVQPVTLQLNGQVGTTLLV